MKNYLLLFISIVFIKTELAAQDNIVPADFNILPPSPVAASLGSYDALSNNMHTGGARASIELLNLPGSFMNIPVSINYASNGVNLDDIGSNAGINWSVNAGGVITRTIRDQPDENSQSYMPNSTNPDDPMFLEFLENASENDILDTEPDLFNFNFLGYSGKFVFDQNESIRILDASIPLVIRFVRNGADISFKVYDDSGLEYHFGFDEAYEKTKINYGGSNCGRNYDMPQITSWYLNKIIDPNDNRIVFNYETYNYSYVTGQKETRYDKQGVSSPCSGAGSCPLIADTYCEIYMEVSHAVYLSSIRSDKSNVIEFAYDMPFARPAIISKIYQMNLQDEVDIIHEFEYSDVGDRSWLTSIKQKSPKGDPNKVYDFQYYSLDALPPRLSYNKDHFGFFNGASNNVLVPNPDNANVSFAGSFADRKPNANTSYYGMLKSITYPTKGTQTFIYEPNDRRKAIVIEPPKGNVGFFIRGANFSDCRQGSRRIDIDEQQEIKINVTGTWTGTKGDVFDATHQRGTFRIFDEANPGIDIIPRLIIRRGDFITQKINLEPGNYRIVLEACSEEFVTNVNCIYYQGESNVSYENRIFGGNRVKCIKTNDGKVDTYQNFIYASYDNISSSSGVVRNDPLYLSFFSNSVQCDAGVVEFCNYAQLSSNSLYNLNSIQGSNVVYRNVITGKSDHYLSDPVNSIGALNGFTENEYYVEIPTNGNKINGDYFFGSTSNTEVMPTGLLQQSSIYAKEGDVFNLVKKVKNVYQLDDRVLADIKGIAIRKKYENRVTKDYYINCNQDNYDSKGSYGASCLTDHLHIYTPNAMFREFLQETPEAALDARKCISSNNDNVVQLLIINPCYQKENQTITIPSTLDYIDAVKYSSKVRWFYLTESLETTYANGQEMTKTTISHYSNPVYRKKDVIEIKIENEVIKESLIKYPYDYQNEINHQILIDNQIIKPIKVTNRNKGTITDEKLFQYNANGKIVTVKQSDEIDQTDYSEEYFNSTGVVYYDRNHLTYDNSGQMIKNAYSSGIIKKYLWDSNKRLLAEVTLNKNLSFFHQNFDETGTQNLENSLSGTGYCETSYDINFPIAGNKEYVLSYFAFSNGKWSHVQEEYTGSRSISAERLDQVSIFPKESLLKSMTYNESDQIDAVYDSNGNVSFYKYDEFNRLEKISDYDKNILKTIDYNYKENPSTN